MSAASGSEQAGLCSSPGVRRLSRCLSTAFIGCFHSLRPALVIWRCWNGWGIRVWPYPFLDLESVLKAIACARLGVDVTLPNACMGGGLFHTRHFF